MTERFILENLVLRYKELREAGTATPPEQLCASFPHLLPELRRRISELGAPDGIQEGQAETALEPTALFDAAEDAPDSGQAVATESQRGAARFRILRAHARGGLGKVSVACDEDLHREVALKEIQDEYADCLESRSRFYREAEITGKLEHPGVVPIYALGRDTHGRPYYAMRFIHGESLRDALARYYHDTGATKNQRDRSLELRKLLNRFVAICNTMAYAHGRGVIHRDLKPDNIMLGQYGETLIVDWGLAKTLSERSPEPGQSSLGNSQCADSDRTAEGVALGTPAYMSPEQASGEVDRVGLHSDIYSLGATLYSLLTGAPPFTGPNRRAVLEKVRRGDYSRPRQLNPKVPRPLEAVCLRAMSFEPSDRYCSCEELASDVERWLADEPVGAYREPPQVRARRWVRRHRTATAVTATTVTMLLVASALGAWKFQHDAAIRATEERMQAATVRRDVEDALGRIANLQQESSWQAASTMIAGAKRRLRDSDPAELHNKVSQAERDVFAAQEFEAIRFRFLGLRDSSDRAALVMPGGAYDRAFSDYCGSRFLEADGAKIAYILRNSGIFSHSVAALDGWIGGAVDLPSAHRHLVDRLIEVRQAVEPHPTMDFLSLIGNEEKYFKRLFQKSIDLEAIRVPDVHGLTPSSIVLVASLQNNTLPLPDPRDIPPGAGPSEIASMIIAKSREGRHPGEILLRRGLEIFPNSFELHFALGSFLQESTPARPEEAAGHFRAASAVRPDVAVAFVALSHSFGSLRRYEDAEAAARTAIRIDSSYGGAYNALGLAQRSQNKLDEAEAAFRTAMEHLSGGTAAIPRINLADMFIGSGRSDEALRLAREALQIAPHRFEAMQVVLRSLMTNREYLAAIELAREMLAIKSHAEVEILLGIALQQSGQSDEAIQLLQPAVLKMPNNHAARLSLANAKAAAGKFGEAADMLRESLRLESLPSQFRDEFSSRAARWEELQRKQEQALQTPE